MRIYTWLSTLPSGQDAHNVISKKNTKHWPIDCIDVCAISVDYAAMVLSRKSENEESENIIVMNPGCRSRESVGKYLLTTLRHSSE